MNAYRAEQLGMCANHHLISALSRFYKVEKWSTKAGGDNEATVKVTRRRLKRIRPGMKCADILRNVRTARNDMTTDPNYFHVYGHMDDVLQDSQLTVEQRLNKRCDTLAKEAVGMAQRLRDSGRERTVAQLLPREVAAVLVDGVKVTGDLGDAIRFGKGREASVTDLKNYSNDLDFTVEEIKAQEIEKITISSTKIRNAIIDGDIEKANSYLSCNFSLSGVVEKGNGIGSSINFPTANIKVENKWKILPKDGAYAVKVFVENQQYFGMLNIGNRPTIADDKHVVEVHIFDFNSTIYNLDIQVEFIKRIRSEKKFNSLEELQSQLEIDESKIKALFNLLR